MHPKSITLFTFGYYGWGNHTPRLIKAVDAAETSRGFKPPIFVDIRIRRSVRAAGFSGAAFEKLLGQDRHRWMKSLGNRFIETRTGPRIQIAEPEAADELLDLAIDSARRKQRILFFCSCRWPKWNGKINCHRTTVAGLVQQAAKRRRVKVEIQEWPGGEPKRITLDLTAEHFASVKKGRMTVPVSNRVDLAAVAGLPWCSIATLQCGEEKLHRVVGPAISHKAGWALPVFPLSFDPESVRECGTMADKLRKQHGLEPVGD